MDAGPAVIDTRADLWSLSALVRWLCADADLPEPFWAAVDRGQATDPGERHADVRAWLAEVEQALAPSEPPEPEASGSGTSERHTESDGASRGRRRALALAGAVAAAALGFGGGWLAETARSDPDSTESARIAIEGPAQVRVGAPARFTLSHEGVASWVWILPTGRHVADQDAVTLTPSGAGSSSVTVRSVDRAGRDMQTSHRFTVTGP